MASREDEICGGEGLTIDLQINGALDPDALSARLRSERRLQIKGFLTADSAAALHEQLSSNQIWYLAYNEHDQNFEIPMAEARRFGPARQNRFLRSINQRATSGFQHLYAQYYITEAIRRGENPGHPLHAVHEFVNGEAWLDFMRKLTGEPAVNATDCLASLYGPGHFLTDHDDSHPRRQRVAAYVLGMTRNWNRNWGGHLVFFDSAGNIERGLIPAFNTLNIFLVPQSHAVQQVTPFASGMRLSVTGWLHR
jgi:SM-20-related protein